MEKYSVLMSVYEGVKLDAFKLSVDSMLKQTVKPDQFILVLDGPVTNDLYDVIKDYMKKYPGLFTIVKLHKNYGLAYALNKGIEASRNELIARMDSDDYSLPERCEQQLKAFKADPELALLGTRVRNFKDDINNIIPFEKKRPTDAESIRRALRRNCPFSHPSVMYKKSAVLASGGYDPSLRRRQDYDLFSRMITNKGYKGENLNKVLLLFRTEEAFFSRNKNKESCQARIVVQRRIFHRKECSILDYLYVWCAMKISMILPIKIYEYIYTLVKTHNGKRNIYGTSKSDN